MTLPSLHLPLHVVIDIYEGPRLPNTFQVGVHVQQGFDIVSHQPMVELAEVRNIAGIWLVETGTQKIGCAAWGALAFRL